jgi:DNA-binding response OmpR family regulator
VSLKESLIALATEHRRTDSSRHSSDFGSHGRKGAIEPQGTILIVDSEPSVRHFIKTILENQDFTVVEAGDADEAYELARRCVHEITLLVTEMNLLLMDGVTLAGYVRTLFPEVAILFIAASEQQTIPLSHSRFLIKPFSAAALSRAVRRTVRNEHSKLVAR